jgi:hypothetical protein
MPCQHPSVSEGDHTAEFFESFYTGAGDRYSQIPWARLSPRPTLVDCWTRNRMFLRTAVRGEDEPAHSRRWPLTLSELRWFEDEGLEMTARLAPDDHEFTHLEYRRPRRDARARASRPLGRRVPLAGLAAR